MSAQHAQAGNIFAPLLGLIIAIFTVIGIGFALSASHLLDELPPTTSWLDSLTISDHSAELGIAKRLEQAQREERQQDSLHALYRAICGNAGWDELGGGAIKCMPRWGYRPHVELAAGGQP